jgi:RNA polymerase sigma-70 factor (ECF subfamily)
LHPGSAVRELTLGSTDVGPAPHERADPSDGALVLAVLRGERAAEERLYRRHAPAVAAVAVRLLGQSAEAEDVVQDSFVTALRCLSQLREPARFRAWLLRIAVHQVHRRFRRRKLLRWLGLGRGADESILAQLAAPSLSAEARVELVRLDAALGSLAPASRIAWILRHVEGYELTEVAGACGVSLATIKRRLHAAETLVRDRVQGGKP